MCFEDGKFAYPRMSRERVNSWSEMCVEEACIGEKGGRGMMRPPFWDGKFGVYPRTLGEGVDSWIGNCEFVSKSLWQGGGKWIDGIFLFLSFLKSYVWNKVNWDTWYSYALSMFLIKIKSLKERFVVWLIISFKCVSI